MKIHSAHFVKSAEALRDYPVSFLPEIAFAGKSNVGKSSLINALVQRKGLAKTSNSPGRTRLINFFTLNDSLSLVDLPGYGFAKVPAEMQKKWAPMVEIYLKSRVTLRLVLLLMDIRRDPAGDDLALLKWFESYGLPCVIVLTKTDKLSRMQAGKRRQAIVQALGGETGPIVLFSVRTAVGRDELWQLIEKYISPSDDAGGNNA